jgi:hypothetical protein
VNVWCELNGEVERLFVVSEPREPYWLLNLTLTLVLAQSSTRNPTQVERKVELLVHQLMQISPAVDAEGKLAPRLQGGRLPHMLESFHQVTPAQMRQPRRLADVWPDCCDWPVGAGRALDAMLMF